MATGLDTDELVKKLMEVESTKVDKLKQKIQLLEWQRDNYREITNLLRSFQSEYFDVLKPDKNIRSVTPFNAFNITYNGSDVSSFLSIKAGSTAIAGTYTIKDVVTAKSAKAIGTSIANGIIGNSVSSLNISALSDNNKISITFNGVSKEITLSDNPTSMLDLQTNLQAEVDKAFGSGKVTVGLNIDKLTFATSNTNTLSFGYAYNSGYNLLLGTDLSSGINLNSQNNKFKVTLDGITKDIVLAEGSYADTNSVLAEMQSKLDSAFGNGKVRALNQGNRIILKPIGTNSVIVNGTLADSNVTAGINIDATNNSLNITLNGDTPITKTITLTEKAYTQEELITEVQTKINSAFGNGKIMVSVDSISGTLKFEEISSTAVLSSAKKENTGLDAIGLSGVNASNKINLSANIWDIRANFNGSLNLTADTTDEDIVFTINDQEFKFNSATTTLNEIITAVNNNSQANVRMVYDQLNDRISLESKDTGVTAKIQTSDQTGNLLQILGLNNLDKTGTDASMVFNDGSGEQIIVRSTNSFTVNGLTFQLNEDTTGPIETKVSSDSSKTYDFIKGFVDKYNEIIDKINGELTEKRYRTYEPLTEAQKKEMSEKDIELWEEKAKSGLLKSDDLLERIVDRMRSSLYDSIKGLDVSLYDIGIETSPLWEDRGKLVINETKLREAISKQPDKVIQLFTRESQYSYETALDDSEKRKIRYEESGIAQRLYDILQDNIRITRDKNGKKGILLEKAGISGDLSDVNNTINNQIKEQEERLKILLDRLVDKENNYYKMFAQMERAIQQLNAQSSWLFQQFSS